MEALAEKFITEDEYWELEAVAETKHEYFNGRIYAMAGAKPMHNKIAFNFAGALSSRLREHSCSGAGSDQAVKVEANGLITYPDLLVVCPPERYDQRNLALLNPRVMIEVLSPSTEKYDRTDKFEFVKQIESLTDYILVAQDRVRVEHYQRDGENWTVRAYYQREAVLNLSDLELEIPLAEIYHRLDLPVGLQVLPRVEGF